MSDTSIIDLDPFEHTKNHYEQVEFFAKALAYGAREGLWTPVFEIQKSEQGQEHWQSQGYKDYDKNLQKYLDSKWKVNRQHPQVSFLRAFGFLERLSLEVYPTYILTPKATNLLEKPSTPVQVFISYKRDVSSLQAILLSNWLWRKGIENYLDIDHVLLGETLNDQLKQAILSRNHFICLLGEVERDNQKINTLNSKYVSQEIELAFLNNKTCIPFLQHDWKRPTSVTEIVGEFLEVPGVEVAPGKVARAQDYSDAMNRLLPKLNISRV